MLNADGPFALYLSCCVQQKCCSAAWLAPLSSPQCAESKGFPGPMASLPYPWAQRQGQGGQATHKIPLSTKHPWQVAKVSRNPNFKLASLHFGGGGLVIFPCVSHHRSVSQLSSYTAVLLACAMSVWTKKVFPIHVFDRPAEN